MVPPQTNLHLSVTRQLASQPRPSNTEGASEPAASTPLASTASPPDFMPPLQEPELKGPSPATVTPCPTPMALGAGGSPWLSRHPTRDFCVKSPLLPVTPKLYMYSSWAPISHLWGRNHYSPPSPDRVPRGGEGILMSFLQALYRNPSPKTYLASFPSGDTESQFVPFLVTLPCLVTSETKIPTRTAHCAIVPAWPIASSQTPGQEPQIPEASQPPSSCSLSLHIILSHQTHFSAPSPIGACPLTSGHRHCPH